MLLFNFLMVYLKMNSLLKHLLHSFCCLFLLALLEIAVNDAVLPEQSVSDHIRNQKTLKTTRNVTSCCNFTPIGALVLSIRLFLKVRGCHGNSGSVFWFIIAHKRERDFEKSTFTSKHVEGRMMGTKGWRAEPSGPLRTEAGLID